MNDEFEDVVGLYVEYWDKDYIFHQKCMAKPTGRWKIDYYNGKPKLYLEVTFTINVKETIETPRKQTLMEKLLFRPAGAETRYKSKKETITKWYHESNLVLTHKRLGKIQECT